MTFTLYLGNDEYSQRVRMVANLAEREDVIGITNVPQELHSLPRWFTYLCQSAGLSTQTPLCRVSYEGYQARVLHESSIISEFLADALELNLTYSATTSAVQKAMMNLYIRHAEDTLIPAGWRFLSSTPGTDHELISFERFYHALEQLDYALQSSGGAYLGGDALTLADVAYAPHIHRFAVACKEFKSYDFLRGENHWRSIRRWMHHLNQLQAFQDVKRDEDELLSTTERELNEDYFNRVGLTRSRPPSEPVLRGFRLPPSDSYAAVMDTLKGAAEEASEVVRNLIGTGAKKTKANDRDIVTEADEQVQNILQSYVNSRHPHHGFLGEESVQPGAGNVEEAVDNVLQNDWVHIVDPLDGTVNSAHSLPLMSISMGVAHKGELVAALVADPIRNETFTAVKGKGAFLNDVPIQVSNTSVLGEALLATGYGASEGASGPVTRTVGALTGEKVQSVRMLGSAAIMLAYTAAGRLEGYCEASLNPWDLAGGMLLVREAGGRVSSLVDGLDAGIKTRPVLATNGKVHDEVLSTLQEANVIGLD